VTLLIFIKNGTNRNFTLLTEQKAIEIIILIVFSFFWSLDELREDVIFENF